ncbi:MAG TPA: CopD family protein [Bradyrhizobium sp.]|nr:CopD family protein [Bradyrhizobium sp.]
MGYLWLKAFHVAAVIGWIGGMLVSSLFIAMHFTSSRPLAAGESRMIEIVRAWDRKVTTPAMLLAWALGMTMAVQAGWFSSRWLMIKLVLVFGLSALHGVQSGTLRRMARGANRSPPAHLRYAASAILVAIAAIAVLAVVKPS